MRKIDAVECKRVADLIRQSFEHCGHEEDTAHLLAVAESLEHLGAIVDLTRPFVPEGNKINISRILMVTTQTLALMVMDKDKKLPFREIFSDFIEQLMSITTILALVEKLGPKEVKEVKIAKNLKASDLN